MIQMLTKEELFTKKAESRWLHQDDKIIMYNKGNVIFAFNFHPEKSFDGYFVPVVVEGTYQVILTTDDGEFGGFNRVDKNCLYEARRTPDNWVGFPCYLPSRCAIVLKRI